MNKISEVLFGILKVAIAILLGILFIRLIKIVRYYSNDAFITKFAFVELIAVICGSICIFLKIKNVYKIAIILILALILRLFWIFSINTLPISDFETMYESAKGILIGDFSALRGHNYLARFPHLVPTTLYIAGIMKIFGENTLMVLKILNVLFNVLSVYLLYKLSDNFVENERIKLVTILLGAIFPAFISYTSVLCTENLAIPFYILTLILFFKAQNANNKKYFFLTGVILAIGNLFRSVAIIFLIGMVIYLLLSNLKNKFINILCIIGGYILVTLSVSGILLGLNIIERPLWKGTEPSAVTLLLKGTNFEHNGSWNAEDAEFVEKHLQDDDLVELCLNKVKERLLSKTPTEIYEFYKQKFISQWVVGDCSGTYWAYLGASIPLTSAVPLFFQYIYIFILFFSLLSILKKGNNSLLYIILFGFILLFMMIEMQSRYSFIISFAFIILPVIGIEYIFNLIQKGKNNGWKNKKSIREYFFE